jgi:hypothetical protein
MTSAQRLRAEIPAGAIDGVERLHAVVDELVAPIVAAHAARLRCRSGCNECCTDGLSVFPVEAAVIARHHAALLAGGQPGAEGACAFLDAEGACRIYEHRPYVCRTQGLPLRWLERDDDGEPCEVRDVCPLNVEGGAPLEELSAEECWTLGPFEERLAARQALVESPAEREHARTPERVALRSLFEGSRRHLPLVR